MGRPSKLAALYSRRHALLSRFASLRDRVNGLLNDPGDLLPAVTCETYIARLEENFRSYEEVQDEIMAHESADVDHEVESFADQEDAFVELLTTLKTRVNAAKSQPLGRSHSSARLNLPLLNLPEFNGKYTEWMSFMDLFRAAVDSDERISDSQKLQYLKASLKDEPLRLVSSLTTTNANYGIALKMLKNRFENKKVLVREHLHAIFSFPPIKTETPAQLRKIVEVVDKNTFSLRTLGLDTTSWDPIISHLVTERLDAETRKQWETHGNNHDSADALPTYAELKRFLETRACALEAVKTSVSAPTRQSPPAHKPSSHVVAANDRSVRSCPCCKSEAHRIYTCPEFNSMSQAQRSAKVRACKLCFNCLSSMHQSRDCKSTTGCRHCSQRHHSLLHTASVAPQSPAVTPVAVAPDPTVPAPPLHSGAGNFQNDNFNDARTLLATALVPVLNRHKTPTDCRALLDNGSETSFISESCVQRLGLKRRKHDIVIQGIGGKECTKTNGIVDISLGANSGITISCAVLPKVTRSMPASFIPVRQWTGAQNLKLADPHFNVPAPTELLLGVDVYDRIVLENKIRDSSGLFLRETLFGWIVSGALKDQKSLTSLHSLHVASSQEFDIARFWQLEELPNASKLSPEEISCVEHYDRTTIRAPDGRFEVKLPFKDNVIPNLDFTYNIALRRLLSMERRFKFDPVLATDYDAFVKEFIDLGHLEPVPDNELVVPPGASCYLPHHAVRKETSTTTKLRVVFDGSAALKDGTSLNTSLLLGPRTQDDLFDILVRFRTHEIALSADIAKMYRQVALQKPDRDYHRLLWRSDPASPVQHFRMTRVTYGVASSSYHSTRSISHIADIENHPVASPVLKRDFYVDDLISGASTPSLARELQQSLVQVLKLAGFDLRKWSSNDSSVISHLPPEMRENANIDFDTSHTVKTLGITWNPSSDCFLFVFAPLPSGSLTKRSLLSDTSRVFDPLGWISPLTVRFKALFQSCWALGVDWDTALPDEIVRSWQSARSSFSSLEKLRIPRFALCSSASRVELHIFCDASETAYGAAAYLLSHDDLGNSICSLLCAKTRVAPAKAVSLPRLELCAAHLGSQLAKCLQLAFSSSAITIAEIVAWSDSTVVLSWLSDLPRRWATFVANRVSDIQNILPSSAWHHVPTLDNPADLASRGCNGQELVDSQLWWRGPSWLTLERSEWPQLPALDRSAAPERRKDKITANVASALEPLIDVTRFSSLSRLTRTFARVLRFTNNLRAKAKLTGPLSAFEIDYALHFLLRSAQMESFSEYPLLLRKQSLPVSSKLLPLAPFYDPDSCLIRVGGRIKHAHVEYSARHPILVPRNCHLATLIVKQIHEDCLHSGPQLTLARISERFWILNARDLVRRVIHACTRCARYSRNVKPPFMADLPEARVTPSRPFTHTGLDYAGPFEIKTRTGRGAQHRKAYLALFVCFSTKATHLETVSDLSTDACIAAIRRFVARRGLPSTMYSDNGTNFVGASKELDSLAKLLQSDSHRESLASFASQTSLVWSFNPPSAPHFGGLWEAGVKGVKSHLRRVVGQTSLTFEELATVFTQIEACLNSRPLTKISADPNDLRPLTPGHFLTGDAILALPQRDLLCANPNRLQRWHLLQKLVQDVWSRWRLEYLASLHTRPKWNTGSDADCALKIGSVVLITDHCAPATWPLAVVSDLHPGKDGITRVVTVRGGSRSYKRPVHTLRILPTDDLLNLSLQGGRHVRAAIEQQHEQRVDKPHVEHTNTRAHAQASQ